MTPKPVHEPLRALALLASAVFCAGLANRVARTDRKLAWTGWAPPPAAVPAAPPAAAPLPVPAPAPAPAPPPAPVPAARAPRAPAAAPAVPPRPAPAQAQTQAPTPAARFAPAPDQVIRELSSEDAWAAYRQRVPFLDARRSAEYQDGHVAGAWSVPVWEADAAARITEFEARANPAPASPIVVYCSGGDCEDSRLLAQRLVQLGYRNLLIYRDGFPDWVQRGRPQAQGSRP